MALLASAVRAVEGERPRFQLGNTGAAFRAGQLLRIEPLLTVDHGDEHQPVGQPRGGLDGSLQAFFDAGLDQQPVHYHFDAVVLAFVEREVFAERPQHAIHAGAFEALAQELLQVLFILALAAADHRSHHHDAVLGPERQHVVENLLGGLARDFVAANGAMRHADGRVQQPQIVVDLGDGAHGGTRAAAGGFLFDGDGRAQAVDGIHVGPLHLVQKLAGVGGEGLHIAALPLGIDRVEGQRRLPGAAQSGDYRKAVAGNFHIDVLQVVLARAMHGNPVQHSWVTDGKIVSLLWRGLSRSANCVIN